MQISLSYLAFIPFGKYPEEGIAGSDGNCIFIFIFLRTFPTSLYVAETVYIPTNTRVIFSTHILTTLVICCLWFLAIQTGVRWYLIVVLVCISLMTKGIFSCTYLPCLYLSSLMKCLFIFFAHSLNDLFISRIESLVIYMVCKCFLPICSSSYPLNRVFCRAKTFNFDEVQFINFFLYGSCFWCELFK